MPLLVRATGQDGTVVRQHERVGVARGNQLHLEEWWAGKRVMVRERERE